LVTLEEEDMDLVLQVERMVLQTHGELFTQLVDVAEKELMV
jgi:hypothetical protein